ncbi:MAG: tetratricopeptide repeat protein [Vicinamibacteria bacterium]
MMRLGILSAIAFFTLQSEDTLVRARLLAESGRLAEAVTLLESRTRTEPRAPELAYLAELQAAAGGLPQAAATLGRALSLAPDQDGLRVTRGAMLFELRRYEDAKSELELAIARRPRSALAHYYLAAVYRGLARLELAETTAERAIALSPPPSKAPLDSPEPAPGVAARHLLAEVRFARGEEVEPILREVLAVEPEHASARYLLARSLQRRGRAEQAAFELRRFDGIKRVEAHLAQGLDLSRLGRSEEAIAELRLAVAANPENARALFLLGRELLRANKAVEAAPIFDRVLALRPDAVPEVDRLLDSFR